MAKKKNFIDQLKGAINNVGKALKQASQNQASSASSGSTKTSPRSTGSSPRFEKLTSIKYQRPSSVREKFSQTTDKPWYTGKNPTQTTDKSWYTGKAPIQTTNKSWYTGKAPTQSQTVARMYTVANGDEQKFRELEAKYNAEIRSAGSPIYAPYVEATNTKAINALTELGYDMSGGVTQKWLDDNKWLLQYGRQTTTGYGPSAPTKKSTALENAAYWYNVLLEDEEATVAAETEYNALADNVKYLVERGYSDDAILKKIKNESFSSTYRTLAKMDEERSLGSAVRLNRSVNYNGDDTIYGMIWAARNGGGSGDYFVDAVKYALGEGNKYVADPKSEAARDPSSPDYNPYYGGSTLHEINMRHGVTSYDDKWFVDNAWMKNGTQQERNDYLDALDAKDNADAAMRELSGEDSFGTLDGWVQRKVDSGMSADEIIDLFDAELNSGDYPTLAKMERLRQRGTYLPLAYEVNFTVPVYEQKIRDMVAERDQAAAAAEAEVKQQEENKQREREERVEAALAGGSAFLSGGMGADGPIDMGQPKQPEEMLPEEEPSAEPEVTPEPTRPAYESSVAFKSVFGTTEEQPREGMADGEFVPQSGMDIGEPTPLSTSTGKMTADSEEGQAYLSMLNGGEWDSAVFSEALASSTNRAGMLDEVEQDILALRSGKPMDQVSGIARSWYNAHAHLLDYDIKGIDYSRNIGVVDDSLDIAQYYGDTLDEIIRLNAEAANVSAITPEKYIENLMQIADVTDIVDGIAARDGEGKEVVAQQVLENIPGQQETLDTIYDSCTKAIEANAAALEEANQQALQASIDAVKAYQAGTASEAQQMFMDNAMAMDSSAVAKNDAAYKEAEAYISNALSPDGLRSRGIMFTTGSAEADMAMDPEMLFNTGAQAYAQGVKGIADAKLQRDLKLATVCGMSLAEYYEAFPEEARTADQILTEAENEYKAAWQDEFGGTIKGLLEMNEAEDEAKEGLGLRESVFGMPAQKFDAMTAASMWKTIDLLFYKGLTGDEAMGAMYREYGGDRAAATASVTEYMESLPEEHQQRKELEAFLGSGADIFSLGKTTGQLKTEAGVINAEADLQTIEKFVSEHGTALEKSMVDITASSMNSIAQMGAAAVGVANGLPNWLASVVAAIPEGGSTGYDLNRQGASYGTSILAAFGQTLWTGLTESFMNTEYLNLGNSPVVQKAKKILGQYELSAMLHGDPGTGAKIMNFFLDAVAASPAEGAQEFFQSLGGSVIENIALNLNGLRKGFVLGKDDLNDAGQEFLMGMVTSLPLSGVGAGIESFTSVAPKLTDARGNLLSLAEAQLLPEYDGALVNSAIDSEVTREAIYEASADLQAIAGSNEQAAVAQAQEEAQTAMLEAEEAQQEADRLDAEMTARQQALESINQQMLETDEFNQDMHDQMTALAESILNDSTALTDAQIKAEEANRKADEAQQKVADAEAVVQEMYDRAMDDAKRRVRPRVVERMYAGVSEDAQTAEQAYLDACARLSDAKNELRSAKADLDVYQRGTARGQEARSAYNEAMKEVERLTEEVETAKRAVDEAYAKTPEAQTEVMLEEDVSAAETAAQEAEAAAEADPDNLQAKAKAGIARAKATAEAALKNLENVRQKVQSMITSADRNVRAQAAADYQAAVQEAEAAQKAVDDAQREYDSEYSAQGKLQKAVANLQQYSNEDILLEDSANHEEAVEAEAEVRDALNNLLTENAQKELDAARSAMDSSSPESIIAYQEAKDRYDTLMKQNLEQAGADVKHIDARTYEDMRDRSVKPFFNTMREKYAPYILPTAETIRGDVNISLPGKKIYIWDKHGGLEVTGQPRTTSELIAAYKDRYRWTWDDMKSYLDKFINAVKTGADIPNTPNMKRIELMIDDALTDGYASMDGRKIQPAYDYLRLKAGDNNLVFEGEDSLDGVSIYDAYGVGSPITPRLQRAVAEAMQANPDSAIRTASGRYLLEIGDKLVYTDGNSDNPAIQEVIVNKCAGLDPDMDEVFKEVMIETDGTESFNESWESCAEGFRDVFEVQDPISRVVAEVPGTSEGDARGAGGRGGREGGRRNQSKISFKREVVRHNDGWTDHAGAAKTGETTTADKNPIEILSDLTRSIKVGYSPSGPMSTGGKRVSSDVMAFYSSKAKGIRVRSQLAGDLATGLHEFGHAVQDRLPSLHATSAMIDALPQGVRDSYTARELDGEAIAEFVVDYMYNRDEAVALAGETFVRDFERMLRTDDALNAAISNARNQVILWNNSDPASKVDAMIKDATEAQKRDKAKTDAWYKRVRTNVFDSNNPLHKLGQKVYDMGRWSKWAANRADVLMEQNLIDMDGNIVGKSVNQQLADIGWKPEMESDTVRYMVARNALSRLEEKKPAFAESEISRDDLEQIVRDIKNNNPKAADAADVFVNFWRFMTDNWLVPSGLMTQETRDKLWEKYPYYVPLNRVVDVNWSKKDIEAGTFKIHGIKQGGSSLEIINPIQNLIAKTQSAVRSVARNQMMQAIDEAVQQGGFEDLIKEIPADMAVTKIDTDELEAAMRAAFDSASDLNSDAVSRAFDLLTDMDEQWRSLNQSLKPNVIAGRRADGTMFFYQVQQGNEDLYKALTYSPKAAEGVLRLWKKVNNAFTQVVTQKNPQFALSNAISDFWTSVNTGSWASNYLTGAAKWAAGFYDVVTNAKGVQEFKAAGGGSHSGYSINTDKGLAQIRRDVLGNKDAIPVRALKGGLKFITAADLNDAIELTSRYVEYKYGKHDKSTAEGRRKAVIASQDVTVDFSMSGANDTVREILQCIPFGNATVQGLNKTLTMLQNLGSSDSYTRNRAAVSLTKTVVNTGITAAVQAYVLGALFGDDDDEEAREAYARLNDEVKAGNLILPLDRESTDAAGYDRPYLRIPLAKDALSRAVYAFALDMFGKVSDMDELSIDMLDVAKSLVTDSLPGQTLSSSVTTALNNKTWYGGQIVSDYMLDSRSPINQTKEDTPAVFRTLAIMATNAVRTVNPDFEGFSPAILAYIFEQNTGYFGKVIMPLVSKGRYDDEWTARGAFENLVYTMSKRFTIDPNVSNSLSADFNNAYSMLEKITAEAKAGLPVDRLGFSLTEEERDRAVNDADRLLKGPMTRAKKEINSLWNEIDIISQSKRLTDSEKAIQIMNIRAEQARIYEEAQLEWGEYVQNYVECDPIITRFVNLFKSKPELN